MSDDVSFEYQTVKVLKGRESKSITQMTSQGWEVVSQEPSGVLRTTINYRRTKKKLPKQQIALIGAGLAIVLVGLGVASLMQGGDEVAEPERQTASGTKEEAKEVVPSPGTIQTPSAPSSRDESQAPDTNVLTVKNNDRVASIMADTDYCSENIAQFAQDFEGHYLRFDGNIGALNNHGAYTTRYDILLGYGDADPNSQPGPAFQFRDVNTTSDLKYVGDEIPESIAAGDNVTVTAEVVKYEPKTCLFLLEPISTEFR